MSVHFYKNVLSDLVNTIIFKTGNTKTYISLLNTGVAPKREVSNKQSSLLDFSLTLPWDFPKQLLNSLIFPGFPDKWLLCC